MEVLDSNNILSASEIDNLFADDVETQETLTETLETTTEKQEETTEINPDDLFEDLSESVGSDKDKEEKEDATSEKESTSPNFYSSIAKALKEDSIFPDLNPEEINDADKFAEMFEQQVQSRLDEKIKRFDEALNAGVDSSVAGQYERTLNQLNSVTSESINDENNENLRKQLIYMDLINKGYSKEDALEEVNEVVENGTDIKRAERALKNNINFFNNKYNEEINAAKAALEKEIKERQKQAEDLKKDMLGNSTVFDGLEVTPAIRLKAYDAITKPIYKDPDTGDSITEVQKYELEHRSEFLKKLGFVYVLTDGFTKLDNLVRGKVNKESKKAIRELENTLNNTQRTSGGNLKFVSGINDDPESVFKGYTLDI